MSYSTPRIESPVTKHIDFAGSTGVFSYYDSKIENKDDRTIILDLPLFVIPIDDTHTVGGFSDEHQGGFYANQVRDIKNDELNVRMKGKSVFIGKYVDAKAVTGVKYQKNLYAVLIHKDGSSEIVCFRIMGAFLNAFIDAKIKVGSDAFQILPEMIEGKKGNNTYQIPQFKKLKVTEKWHQPCVDHDVELQAWLHEVLKDKPAIEEVDEQVKNDNSSTVIDALAGGPPIDNFEPLSDDDSDDLPF